LITPFLKQARIEILLWLRRREAVVFSLLLPVMFLAFFGALYGAQKVKGTDISYISYLVPGYAVYAIMASALGTLAVNLATERDTKILKRLGVTPLPRTALIGAKVVAGAVLIAAVIAVLILVGTLGYKAHVYGNVFAGLFILAVGIFSFATLGIVLGGLVKPDSSVAVSNLFYLALSFLGGVFIPLDQFPSGLRHVAEILPSERLNDALQTVWTRGQGLGDTGWDLPIVVAWALAAVLLGSRRFQWQ